MNAMGMFEVKTKFSELCEQVVQRGETMVVTRRGKPFVVISPFEERGRKKPDIWELRARNERKFGRVKEDFDLTPRETQSWRDPLAD